MLHSITWPNLILWLPLLFDILSITCIVTVCFPGCNVKNFEINKVKPFFCMTKMQSQKSKWNKKTFFIIFKGLLVAKGCLRPKTAVSNQVKIFSLDDSFTVNTKVKKVERSASFLLTSLKCNQLLKRYNHFKKIKLKDNDMKDLFLIHLISSDYAKIKTRVTPKIENMEKPITKLTTFGWAVMLSGKENILSNLYLAQSLAAANEPLCKLGIFRNLTTWYKTDSKVT